MESVHSGTYHQTCIDNGLVDKKDMHFIAKTVGTLLVAPSRVPSQASIRRWDEQCISPLNPSNTARIQ